MDALLRLQQDIADRLESHSYFSDVPVLVEKPLRTVGEVTQEEFWLTKKDGTNNGVGVLVRRPELHVPLPNLPGPQFDARVVARVVEQPLVSEGATGLSAVKSKTANSVAKKVAQALHQWAPDGWQMVHLRDLAMANVVTDARVRMLDVFLWTTLPEEQESRTVRPTITVAGGSASIVCGEAADIYYTTDESFPSLAAGATLYVTSFAAVSGTVIRAAAYATGKEGSDVHRVTA